MQPTALRRFAIAFVAVLAAAGVAASLRQQGAPTDVISREWSFNAGGAQQRDVISREWSFRTGPVEQRDVVSREWSFNAGAVRYLDVVSREFSFHAPPAGPDLVVESAGTVIPSDGIVDQPFQVRWRGRNAGTFAAQGPWVDTIRYSTNIRPATGGAAATAFSIAGPPTLEPGAAYEQVRTFLMPSVPGPFTVTIETDSGGAVSESIEDNNLLGPRTVVVGAPNLRALVTAAPSGNVTAGDSVSISFKVWNDGNGPTTTPQWSDRVYLVQVQNGQFRHLRTFGNQSALQNDPGGNGTVPLTFYEQVQQSLQLPPDIVGTCYLAVRTDDPSVQVESDEDDNLATSATIATFEIVPPVRPNLLATGIALQGAVTGTPLASGSVYTVQWRVENSSTLADFLGGATTTEIWLSANGTTAGPNALDGDVRLASFAQFLPVIPRNDGSTGLLSREVLMPANLPSVDQVHFKVWIDAFDQADEDEVAAPPYFDNLGSHGPFTIVPTGTYDLDASAIALLAGQGPPQAAHPITFRWTVQNIGRSDWPVPLSWQDEVWLSRTPVLDPIVGTRLGTYTQGSVQLPGETVWRVGTSDQYEKTASYVLPETAEAGDYYLILVTDSGLQLTEFAGGPGSGEGNNREASAVFTIERRPADLSIAAGIGGGIQMPPSQGAPGQTVTLPWTVTNVSGVGSTSASSWTDRVYLSTSATGLVDAVTLAVAAHSGALAPGSSYSQSRTAVIPDLPAGARWLHFVADTSGVVFEDGALANNVAVTPFQVVAPESDLVVEQVSASSRMRAGDVVAASWRVRNSGVASTGGSGWVDTLVLSDTPNPDQATIVRFLGSWPRTSALAAGSSYTATTSFAVPVGLTPGAWYVVVRTDAANQVFEGNELNNVRASRTVVDIEAPPPGGGGGGGSGQPGQGWLPANLVPSNVRVLNGPVTAGQEVEVAWDLANSGLAPTSSASWSDSVYLSADPLLGPGDERIGFFQHDTYLAHGESGSFSDRFIVPLWANGNWFVLVRTDETSAVEQGAWTGDDVAVSTALFQVVPPPLTDLDVSAVTFATPSVLLGASLDFSWTTRNDSPTPIPGVWSWTDGFWLVPGGLPPVLGSLASPDARFLGQIASDAGTIPASPGAHTQSSGTALTVPPLPPGPYRIVVRSDVFGQIAEADEGALDNTHFSASTIDLQAIPLASGGSATAELPNGASRWFVLTAPPDTTIDLLLQHDAAAAACELYVQADVPPSLGVYDLASEGIDVIQPNHQSVRIPRTSGADYYILARAVSGVGAVTSASIQAVVRPFSVEGVSPAAVGAGPVTIAIRGAQLWRRSPTAPTDSSVKLRVPGATEMTSSVETRLLPDGTLLARFDLAGQAPGPREVLVFDGSEPAVGMAELVVEPVLPLALRVELDAPQSIRRGERGTGRLRVVNAGNVDLPYAVATVGHAHLSSAVQPAERMLLASPSQSAGAIAGGDPREALVVVVEDLGPGRGHELPVEFDVGGLFALDGAAIGVAGSPEDVSSFAQGTLLALSRGLRAALAVDPSTPAALSDEVQDPAAWDAAVSAAIAAGDLVFDVGSIEAESVQALSLRDLVGVIAQGLVDYLQLPVGAAVPETAIDAAAESAFCANFAGDPLFECEGVFPSNCAGNSASAGLTSVQGGNAPLGLVCIGTPEPIDPTVKIEPRGVGVSQAVNASRPLQYEVHFENLEGAPAWASRILVTDELEPSFRSSSVRFEELRIGATTIAFAPNTTGYVGQVLLEIDATRTVICQISALVNASTNTIEVYLQALDPDTGLPDSSADFGLLPPNAPGLEELATGYLKFRVLPSETMAMLGTAVESRSARPMRNRARTQLNASPPFVTNQTTNILDDGAPTSGLVLESVAANVVQLSWNAVDTETLASGEFPGTGIQTYTVSVAPTDQGPWTGIQTDTRETSLAYSAEFGETVYFKVEATDRVGNAETKLTADLAVTLPTDCNGNGIADPEDLESGTLTDANGNGQPDECECTVESYCVSTPDPNGRVARISSSGVPSVSGGNFTVLVEGAQPNSRGMFFLGRASQQAPLGDGFLCVTQDVLRLRPLLFTSSTGTASVTLDFSVPPIGSGPQAITPGTTRYFQFWFRNVQLPGSAGSDASDALRVTFCD